MTTSALAPSLDPAEPGRTPWRAFALLTAMVVAAHVVLLGLVPDAAGPAATPLSDRFITRTIVIAPPVAAPAPKAQPSPQPVPRPVHRRAEPPATPATPATTLPEPPAAQTPIAPTPAPEVVTQADDGARPAETAASAPAAAAAADGTTAATAAESTASAPTAAASSPTGTVADAPVPLRIPGSVQLRFAVTAQQGAQPLQGVFGALDWLQDGRNYDARLALTFFFKTLRTQHSTGVIGPTGIEPARFSDARKGEVASHFVRDQGLVIFSNNAPSVPLLAGAQDRLSVVMQLGALIAGDPARYPPGGVIAMQTVGPRDADIWSFRVGEDETLTLPAGEFAARRLTRSPRKPFDDTVEVWVAPALGYLPVRIRQTQPNGDFADMQLRDQLPLQSTR